MRAIIAPLFATGLCTSVALLSVGCDDNPGTQRVMESPSPAPEDDVGVGGGLSGDGYISPEGQTGSSFGGAED
jgi:hypothetical protein